MANLFAARLAASGVRVTMLGSWPDGLLALRHHGVGLVNKDGNHQRFPVRVIDNPTDGLGSSYALVLVKSWQTPRAAQQLAVCLEKDGLALTLQNGLYNHQILVDALGPQRAALGVTTTGATLQQPGLVLPVGDGLISLGTHERIDPIADMLSEAGFKVEMIADTSALLWGKLVINAAINPLTALLRVQNGELLGRPTIRELLGSTAREAAKVAGAQGIQLPYTDPVKVVENVAFRTAKNYSSMLRDIERGAPTEIDAINGAIVTAGEQSAVPTPINRALWELVKGLVYNHQSKKDGR